jgi:hypothetical protein
MVFYRSPPVVIRSQIPSLALVFLPISLISGKLDLLLLAHLSGKGGIVDIRRESVTAKPKADVAVNSSLQELSLKRIYALQQLRGIASEYKVSNLHLNMMISL